jgi:hypothetical protein
VAARDGFVGFAAAAAGALSFSSVGEGGAAHPSC